MFKIPKQKTAEGCFSQYYRIGQLGLKALRSRDHYGCVFHSFTERVSEALHELEYMHRAFEVGLAPRPYGFIVTKQKRVALVVQHLDDESETDEEKIVSDMESALLDIGIDHADVHEDNIVIHNGQLKCIDFTPALIG